MPGVTSCFGERINRLEDARLLTGGGRYIADIVVPGMLHAVFVRSTVAHARIVRIDATPARLESGVVAVLTAIDIPHRPLVDGVQLAGLVHTPQAALATERVRYVGEAVAVVLASSRALAEDAAELVDVEYDLLPVIVDAEAAVAATDGPILLDGATSNVIYDGVRHGGDVDGAFAGAAHVVSGRFHNGRISACPMEARGCVAIPGTATGPAQLTLYSSTQSPHLLRAKVASCLSIPQGRVQVLVPEVGGAFGVKIPASPEEVAVALAARLVRRPVSWIEDRAEYLLAGPQAKDQVIDAELAVARDGTFLGIRATILGDAGAYSYNSASALVEPYLASGLLPGPYRIAAYECRIIAVLTNKAPIAPYRGVGWTASHSARELLVERAARLLGRDPADLRRQNLIRPEEFPYRSVTGMTYDSGSFVESLDAALALVGYPEVRRRQHQENAAGPLIGVGVSPYVEPGGWGSRGAGESAWYFPSHDAVRVSVEPSGDVMVAVGTPSQGQGLETTLAQVVASELGVRLDDVTVVTNDTAATPVSTAGTRASRGAVVSGGAVAHAASAVRDALCDVAAAMFECAPADVVFADGVAQVQGVPSRRATVAELARAAYFDLGIRESLASPELVAQRFYDPPPSYSNGCVVAVVEVDPETLAVRVVDAAVVEDCGRMINPMIVEGQMLGAFAQGVGAALLEAVRYVDDGQIGTASFMDYLLPTAAEIPRVRLGHLESPSPVTHNGVKGMGESGMIAAPGAVILAIADAIRRLGVVPSCTPVTGDDLDRRLSEAALNASQPSYQ